MSPQIRKTKMKKLLIPLAALAVVGGVAGTAAINYFDEPDIHLVDLVVGRPAPNFTLPDANGRPVRLADFKGKTVVLEWNNPGCPFVKKQYGSGEMQRAQAAAARDGVVWLTVNSGAPGKQGHMNGDEAKDYVADKGARPAAYLLDPRGEVGKAYGARTTPHMFVINGAGSLVYAGAIDDTEGSDGEDTEIRNHVLAALAELNAGQPVSVSTTRPFGCSVKYDA
jgi:hypothetical protein